MKDEVRQKHAETVKIIHVFINKEGRVHPRNLEVRRLIHVCLLSYNNKLSTVQPSIATIETKRKETEELYVIG